MYDHERFMTMTAKHFPGTPTSIEARPEAVEAIYRRTVAKRGIATDSDEEHEDVDPRLRFTAGHPCWACKGHKDMPQGQGTRCWGHDSSYFDGFICTRSEFAGKLKASVNALGATYWLHSYGACGCGETHGYRLEGTLPRETALNVLMHRVLEALAVANKPPYRPHIFVRGGKLVRVHTDEEGRPSIERLQHAGLQAEIAAVVQFTKKLKSEPLPINVPHPEDALVSTVLQAAEYKDMPPLAGLTEVPVLRADGSVLDLPGYDSATRLLYRPVIGSKRIATVADSPSHEDVTAALALIWEAIGSFPYETLADKANALGLLLTLVLRPAIRGQVPLALIDAPRAGTGKSLLAKVITSHLINKW